MDTAQTDPTKPKPPVPGMEAIQPNPVNQVQAPTTAPVGTPQVAPPMPPPPPAPTSTAPSSVPTAPVSATNNLLSTQINPSAPTATAPKTTDFGTGAITAQANPQDSARFQSYSGGLDNALNQLSSGPDRTALAMQKLQDFDTAGQPELEAGFRRVGQVAAKFGRLGSGMTTNDLTGLQGTYDRNKMLLKNELARSVAEGDINDRFRRADAFGQARGQEYGFGQDNRDYLTGINQYNQGALFDRQRAGNDAQSGYEDRLFNQQRAGENDLRGERDYQTNRSDKALEDSIRQRMLEDSLLNSSFGRSQDRLSAGSYGSPAGAYQDFAGQLSGDAGDLMGAGAGLITGANTKQPQIDYGALIQQILGMGGG